VDGLRQKCSVAATLFISAKFKQTLIVTLSLTETADAPRPVIFTNNCRAVSYFFVMTKVRTLCI